MEVDKNKELPQETQKLSRSDQTNVSKNGQVEAKPNNVGNELANTNVGIETVPEEHKNLFITMGPTSKALYAELDESGQKEFWGYVDQGYTVSGRYLLSPNCPNPSDLSNEAELFAQKHSVPYEEGERMVKENLLKTNRIEISTLSQKPKPFKAV